MALIQVDWNPSPRKLSQFAWGLVLFGLAGAALAWRHGHSGRCIGWLVVGGGLGALSLASSAAGAAIYRCWMTAVYPIGVAVSTCLLAGLYYLVVTPIGLALRMAGHDALRLRKPTGDSYFTPVEMPEDPAYYERLY